MISLERLQEMRAAELILVTRPCVPDNVRRVAQDYSDALAELITRRRLDLVLAEGAGDSNALAGAGINSLGGAGLRIMEQPVTAIEDSTELWGRA